MFNLVNDNALDDYAAVLAGFEGLPPGFNLDDIEDHQETLAAALTYYYLTYKLRSFLENQSETPYFRKVRDTDSDLPSWATKALADNKILHAFDPKQVPENIESDLKIAVEYLKDMARQYLWATSELARRTKHPAKVRANYLKEDGRFQDFNKTIIQAKHWQVSQEKVFKEGLIKGTKQLAEKENLKIVELSTKEALQDEGKKMHNCIGKLHVTPVLSGEETIYSVRDENNKSIISAAIKKGKLTEVKREFNKKIRFSQPELFLLTWLLSQNVGVTLRTLLDIGFVVWNNKLWRLEDLPKDRICVIEHNIVINKKSGTLPDLSNIHCKGNFICSGCDLTSLKGCPKIVEGNFCCSNNKLTTLEGSPQMIGGEFICSNNPLVSLRGIPSKVNELDCSHCELESLDGAPEIVSGSFLCSHNKLTSLRGAPKVGERFDCSHNKLQSLLGAPQIAGGTFDCSYNQLQSLHGGPQIIKGRFMCSNNRLTTLDGAPESVDKMFDCSNNQLTTCEGLPGGVKVLKVSNNNIKSFQGLPPVEELMASKNPLNSLRGIPDGVESVSLIECGLTSLVGLPDKLKELNVDKNKLKNFIGMPREIDYFSAADNPLESLDGLPQIIHEGCVIYDWPDRAKLMDKVVAAGGSFISEFEMKERELIPFKHIMGLKNEIHCDRASMRATLDEFIDATKIISMENATKLISMENDTSKPININTLIVNRNDLML